MAKKIHSRRRRYQPVKQGRNRKPRPRSFPTEGQAQAYAKLHGITNFTLRNLRNAESKSKKFLIVQK